MGQATTLTIADGAATPVNVTYTPFYDASTGIWYFKDKRNGSSALQPNFSVLFSNASSGRPTEKTTIRVAYPMKEVVNGVDKLLAVGRVDKVFTIPTVFDATSRAHIQALSANLEDQALIKGIIKDSDPIF